MRACGKYSLPFSRPEGVTKLPLVAKYTSIGGRHGESAAVANVLSWLGVTSPHTGKPYTEEMLFGLGGGLGFGYWVFDYAHMPQPVLSVGFRRFGWEGFDLAFMEDMCERVGATVGVRETSSKAMAQRSLLGVLAEGQPAILTTDWGKLPGSPFPDEMEYVPHVLVVCGTASEDAFLVDDLDPEPKTVSAVDLACSRAAVKSMHHRMRLLQLSEERVNLNESIGDALADCAESLLEPTRPNSGLPALAKWARMVGTRTETKGWRSVFGSADRLANALSWTARWIEAGTGGGGFRLMYADFLDEAAGTLGEASLRELAADYRVLGAEWSGFASAVKSLAMAPEEGLLELDALSDRLGEIHDEELRTAERLRDAAREQAGVKA